MNTRQFGLALRAVIRDDAGRCLLVRRSAANKGNVGCWEWPGGKADPGEAFDAALRREVREETGLEIELLGVAGAFGFDLGQTHIVTLCLEAKPAGGTVQLSEEHDAYEWVPPSELTARNLTPVLRETAAAFAAAASKKGAGSRE